MWTAYIAFMADLYDNGQTLYVGAVTHLSHSLLVVLDQLTKLINAYPSSTPFQLI